MAAILKALSTVMNEKRRNKVFTMIKQLKKREYSKDTHFSIKLLHPCVGCFFFVFFFFWGGGGGGGVNGPLR